MANGKVDSGLTEEANRLLEAFYDEAGGKLTDPVPLGGEDEEESGAAERAGLTSDHAQRDTALNYLLNQGYLQADENGMGYRLTLAGSDYVRDELKPTPVSEVRSGMDDQTQRRLLTLFSTIVALAISQPITNYIAEQIPERRGIKDDALEALLQGVVRAISIFVASLVVRKVAGRWGSDS
ncbi:MAG: hypothetical protein ACFB50_07540 [Rubrobacteraceae bacterium]